MPIYLIFILCVNLYAKFKVAVDSESSLCSLHYLGNSWRFWFRVERQTNWFLTGSIVRHRITVILSFKFGDQSIQHKFESLSWTSGFWDGFCFGTSNLHHQPSKVIVRNWICCSVVQNVSSRGRCTVSLRGLLMALPWCKDCFQK